MMKKEEKNVEYFVIEKDKVSEKVRVMKKHSYMLLMCVEYRGLRKFFSIFFPFR